MLGKKWNWEELKSWIALSVYYQTMINPLPFFMQQITEI